MSDPHDRPARGSPDRAEVRGPLDRAGVESLYRSHGHLVLRRAALLLGSQADAQEALQEVFAALLREPGALREAGSVVAWLYRAATHHCLNVLRHRRTRARLAERQPTPDAGGAAEAARTSPTRAEALADVRRLLALLPDEEGSAVVYHHLDGMTYDEVAEQLGCSRRKVGYLLERAQGVMERERAERIA